MTQAIDDLQTEWSAPIRLMGSSGEAVVLIHGFTGHPGHWIPISEALADRGHTVIAPRLAGHGTSPDDLATTRWHDWFDSALEATRSVADHRRVHLVGLSMGGMISILVARATAAATITAINTPVLVRDARVMLAPLMHPIIRTTTATDLASPDPSLAHLWTPYDTNPTVAVAELLKLVWRGWWQAGDIRRPSLVVQSRTDEAVLPISGRMLARRLQAETLWLPSARHNAILDPARGKIAHSIARLIAD